MKKYFLIDERIRKEEYDLLSKYGHVITIQKNNNLYEEISSHTDILCTKVLNTLIVDKSNYDNLKNSIKNNDIKIVCGKTDLKEKYPYDICYNVCILNNIAIHNFKYTDKIVKTIIDKNDIKKISVKQGYTKCSIAVIDDTSVITTDKKIKEKLEDFNIDVLYLDYIPDIKLYNNNSYSTMNGFVGGTISILDENNVVIFGDLNKIDKNDKIKKFILSKNKNIIDFKNLDVVDYGGMIAF